MAGAKNKRMAQVSQKEQLLKQALATGAVLSSERGDSNELFAILFEHPNFLLAILGGSTWFYGKRNVVTNGWIFWYSPRVQLVNSERVKCRRHFRSG